ncbi:MAG: hypothetical protein EBT47_07160 [Chloroflexi bacterium]|nr:hypothetical protein [Chloroflexota bacterium]
MTPTFFAGYFAQYFEKGRLEDQTGISQDPNWQFQYGLLVDELQTLRLSLPIGGEISTLNYQAVNDLAREDRRIPPPTGFLGGTMTNSDGSVFVPYSQALQPAPGHSVSPVFWPYINRSDIFPGGWLHDIGLPMTEAVPAVVTKGPFANRNILVQVFQRTILTYDPLNGAEFQVERANVGSDYRRAFPDRVPHRGVGSRPPCGSQLPDPTCLQHVRASGRGRPPEERVHGVRARTVLRIRP